MRQLGMSGSIFGRHVKLSSMLPWCCLDPFKSQVWWRHAKWSASIRYDGPYYIFGKKNPPL